MKIADLHPWLVVRSYLLGAANPRLETDLDARWHITREPYRVPEPSAQDERRKHQLVHRMQQRIERLGYVVTIAPMPARAA